MPSTATPPTVVLTTPSPVYHGTTHTLSCTASYDTNLIDTTPVLNFAWALDDITVIMGAITMINTLDTSSSLILSPVNTPSLTSGDYSCTVTLSESNALVVSSEASDTVNLVVQGMYCYCCCLSC